MESILNTIKKTLGVELDYNAFDDEIITHINSVFMTLNQLGVGPTTGFRISDENDSWTDFLGAVNYLEGVKSYTYLKVKLLFDPPTNSFLVDSINNQAEEYAFRILAQIETAEA